MLRQVLATSVLNVTGFWFVLVLGLEIDALGVGSAADLV